MSIELPPPPIEPLDNAAKVNPNDVYYVASWLAARLSDDVTGHGLIITNRSIDGSHCKVKINTRDLAEDLLCFMSAEGLPRKGGT